MVLRCLKHENVHRIPNKVSRNVCLHPILHLTFSVANNVADGHLSQKVEERRRRVKGTRGGGRIHIYVVQTAYRYGLLFLWGAAIVDKAYVTVVALLHGFCKSAWSSTSDCSTVPDSHGELSPEIIGEACRQTYE